MCNTVHQPIFLLGSHKSGSSLLRALLDGSDGLAVLPRETHAFAYSGHWVDYALMGVLPRRLDTDRIKQSFKAYVSHKNKTDNPYDDAPQGEHFDLSRFDELIDGLPTSEPKAAIATYWSALHYAHTGRRLDRGTRLVEKSVDHAEYASTLQSLFPDGRFVHIVRNPYATLVAIRRSISQKRFPALDKAAFALYNSYYWFWRNQETISGYLVIRYEDLLTETIKTVELIAEHLGLQFDPGMLTPTANGEPWVGNSTNNVSFQGISTTPLTAWKQHVTPVEIEIVNRFASPVMDHFGYDKLKPARSLLCPNRGESAHAYVKNRVLPSMLYRRASPGGLGTEAG